MISPCSVLAPQICLVLALGSSAVSIQAAEEAEAKQALDQIVQKLNALEEWFTDAQQRSISIQQQIQRQDQTIAQLRRQSRQLEASISEIEHLSTLLIFSPHFHNNEYFLEPHSSTFNSFFLL